MQVGAVPFHAVGVGSINKRRVEALNAFYKLVPHAGLALLNMLLKADLIASHASRKYIQLYKRRIAEKDKTESLVFQSDGR